MQSAANRPSTCHVPALLRLGPLAATALTTAHRHSPPLVTRRHSPPLASTRRHSPPLTALRPLASVRPLASLQCAPLDGQSVDVGMCRYRCRYTNAHSADSRRANPGSPDQGLTIYGETLALIKRFSLPVTARTTACCGGGGGGSSDGA